MTTGVGASLVAVGAVLTGQLPWYALAALALVPVLVRLPLPKAAPWIQAVVAALYAAASGCKLTVAAVDPLLAISANRERLLAALANLLQNAFKFTQPHTEVRLEAYAFGLNVLIEVKDHCGGLPHADHETMFLPFSQRSADRSGLGLGLSIARQSVENDGGILSVRDVPSTGCVFTISLPRHMLV